MTIWKFEIYSKDTLCCKVVVRGENEEIAQRQAEKYAEKHPGHTVKSCRLASASEVKYLSDEDSATPIMYRPLPEMEAVE